jgi:hypothetical protein
MMVLTQASYTSRKKFFMASSTAGEVGLYAAVVYAEDRAEEAADAPREAELLVEWVSGQERRRNLMLPAVRKAEM